MIAAMQSCRQTPTQTIYEHGLSVADYYRDLRDHLEHKTPLKYEWRLPSWINDPWLLDNQHPREIMYDYHLYHDCGKPYCRTIDENGRQHFPDHAEVSAKIWESLGGDPLIGDLIRNDMRLHTAKQNDLMAILYYIGSETLASLLLTALAEIHSNAALFGGIESDSFKIKWKRLEKTGRFIVKAHHTGE